MSGKKNFLNRRFAIRVALVALLIFIAFVMYDMGKEHTVLMDNKPVTIDGVEYAPIETLSLFVDDVKKNDVRADGRVAHKMVGKNHRIKLAVMRQDKTVEKTVERMVRLDLNMKEWMISLPALAAEAPNIYIPNPVKTQAPPPDTTQTPSAEPDESFSPTGADDVIELTPDI
jgi:hypothetical protein